MAGQLAIRAPHLDGSEPIGLWFDAAWAVYGDFLMDVDSQRLDVLDEAMTGLLEPDVDQDGAPTGADAPTMETWGADPAAQASQAALMRSLMAHGLGPADGSSGFGAMGGE